MAPGTADPLDRRRAVVRWAVGASWVWLVPLAGVAFVSGYLSLLFTSLAAEALDGEVTAWVILLAFGLPALALLSAAVAGLCTALVMARWMSRLAPVARVYPWVIGLGAAALGAVAAVMVFWAAMAGVDGVGVP